MKKLIILISFLFLFTSQAYANPFMQIMGSGGNAVITYLMDEDFEGDGAANSVFADVGGAGGADYNFGDEEGETPINGERSLSVTGTQAVRSSDIESYSGDDIYILWKMLYAGSFSVMRMYNTAGSLSKVDFSSSNICMTPFGGTQVCSGSGYISTESVQYWKVLYRQGSGTNHLLTVWISTDGQNWNQAATNNDGTSTTALASISFNSGPGIIDDVLISTTNINY